MHLRVIGGATVRAAAWTPVLLEGKSRDRTNSDVQRGKESKQVSGVATCLRVEALISVDSSGHYRRSVQRF